VLDLLDHGRPQLAGQEILAAEVVGVRVEVVASGVVFGYGVVTTPPPQTQGTIGQAALCKDNTDMDIPNTACIIYNSRGVPIDSTSAPTPLDALYVTDGTAVFGVTVAATGMLRTWRTLPVAIPAWTLN